MIEMQFKLATTNLKGLSRCFIAFKCFSVTICSHKIHYMQMFDLGQNQVHNSLLVQLGNLYTQLKGSVRVIHYIQMFTIKTNPRYTLIFNLRSDLRFSFTGNSQVILHHRTGLRYFVTPNNLQSSVPYDYMS